MLWTQVLVLSIAFLALYVWMALALGAVFAKLGVTTGAAWIPVRRYVVAARAAELPTAPVWISRCVAAVAWLALAVVVLLRASDAVAGSSGLRTFAALRIRAWRSRILGWLVDVDCNRKPPRTATCGAAPTLVARRAPATRVGIRYRIWRHASGRWRARRRCFRAVD